MTLTVRTLLKGCTPGVMQKVAIVTVLPLLADKKYQSDVIATPNNVMLRNNTYGEMTFINNSDKPVIIPAHAVYLTKEKVQDHAMVKAGIVPANKSKTFNDACCVESSQSGYFEPKVREVTILPWSLREFATSQRDKGKFNKLWDSLALFNEESGSGTQSHLAHFYEKFTKDLEQFVAQFEVVPGQVGAIILINGTVFGIERTPSEEYFRNIFEALIRSCYGAAALRVSQGINPVKTSEYNTYVHIDENVTNINELQRAYADAKAREREIATEIIAGLLDDPLEVSQDQSSSGFIASTVNNSQLVGQTISHDGNPIYSSIVVKKDWLKNQKWFKAPMFEL